MAFVLLTLKNNYLFIYFKVRYITKKITFLQCTNALRKWSTGLSRVKITIHHNNISFYLKIIKENTK